MINDQKLVNALRFLSVDMIQKAGSGHPGVAIDAAPMAFALWEKQMNFNPGDPKWINRDRFVLSAGHGSSLLYSLLYFNKFGLTLDDLKDFRQLNSLTPGHPEYGHTDGVDATTGPLSQGIATAVGMAMAEKHLAAVYNRPGFDVLNHYTYTIVGDGDLMEGLSQEAITLAGQKGLNKLIVLYDSNDVSLDGPLSLSMNDNVKLRFESAGWDYQKVNDGNSDVGGIVAAIEKAKSTTKPSIIEIKTTIGYGAPNQGTNKVHGAALGADGVQVMREALTWKDGPFEFSDEIYTAFNEYVDAKKEPYQKWQRMFEQYRSDYPKLADDLLSDGTLDAKGLNVDYQPGDEVATRSVSHEIMQQLSIDNVKFWGGSADLSSSNKTYLENQGDFTADTPDGKNVFFGVREFGMAAAVNGMNLHGGNRAFGSLFFVFTDYMRAAVRLAALMNLPSIFVASHDSIAVGEDGPTHEPIEHLASFRAMPNLNVLRPADANETLAAWNLIAHTSSRPSLLVTSRQKLPVLSETVDAPVEKGAYIVSDSKSDFPDGILLAAGSEVSLALEAKKLLENENFDIRVVSVPVMNLFDEQSDEYKESVLPQNVTNRLAIEMGASQSWYKYTGLNGDVMGIDSFGKSGKGPEVIEDFGFTPENVAKRFNKLWETNDHN